jgi:hypothetical protein
MKASGGFLRQDSNRARRRSSHISGPSPAQCQIRLSKSLVVLHPLPPTRTALTRPESRSHWLSSGVPVL